MAQFRYRLQTLLDEKTREKQAAQQMLAVTQKELREEQDELEMCRREQETAANRLKRARAEMIPSVSGDTSAGWVRLRRDHIERLKDECNDSSDATRAQEVRVSEAEERFTGARQTLAARCRDVEVLEKHRARLEHRFIRELEQKEALAQEEMANIIFLQQSSPT
jgi:YscO-like protein